MNFFGHAVVATWHATEPRFVLGAMLPDFAAMIRARPPAARDPELARGIALHHATDEVFHDAPTFRELGYDIVWDQYRGVSMPPGVPN